MKTFIIFIVIAVVVVVGGVVWYKQQTPSTNEILPLPQLVPEVQVEGVPTTMPAPAPTKAPTPKSPVLRPTPPLTIPSPMPPAAIQPVPPPLTLPMPMTPVSAPTPVSAIIANFSFSPTTITLKKGTTITWTNNDTAGHTITFDEDVNNGPNSSLLGKGDSYSYTFNTVGNFNYHCSTHPFMHGTVVVK